jgi:hypothetical protein
MTAQTRDQVNLFRTTLGMETDQGVALVSAAYLGEELRMLLEKMFVHSPKTIHALFEGAGPLATFSSRIDLAFAVGLLSQEPHRLLHLIRKIRNDFAHQHHEMSFTDEGIAARCQKLVALMPPVDEKYGLATLIPPVDEKRPRYLYIRVVMYLLAEIHVRTETAHRAEVRSFSPVGDEFDYLRFESAVEALMSTFTWEEKVLFASPNTPEDERKRLMTEAFRRKGIEGVEFGPQRK